MSGFDHLDVFMRMLEVIEKDIQLRPLAASAEQRSRVTTIIEKLEGTLVVHAVEKEVIVSGDHFENITNSIIATRGSIAKGVIAVGEKHGQDVADAIQILTEALSQPDVPPAEQMEALELVNEIASQAGNKQASKSVLKSLGTGLKSVLDNIGSVASVATKVWPVIEKIWL